jgi:hypothetical protein
MAKKELPINEVVESHKPKNFKYYYHFHNPDDLVELEKLGYDIASLDTICNADLIEAAKAAEFKYHDRDIVAHAKDPVMLERGVVMTKKMATKTDKKLLQVGYAFFTFNEVDYAAIKLCYERFDIYEIFIMI